MKFYTFLFLLIISTLIANSQIATVESPNGKIKVGLYGKDKDSWFLSVTYGDKGKGYNIIPQITLGLSRSDQDFSKELNLRRTGKPTFLKEQYAALHGKRSQCINYGNEVIISFENRWIGVSI